MDFRDGWGKEPGDILCPALPLVLGANPFTCDVELVIITEGQWDALTLFGALGGADRWPDPVVIFGIRGVQGVEPFLSYYGAWLKSAKPKVWLLPDNDEAAQSWTSPKRGVGRLPSVPFRNRLLRAGLKVKESPVAGNYGKDFNDYYKKIKPNRKEMLQWIKSLNLM